METRYDTLVNLFLNNWYIAVVVFVCVILMAIPQIREGFKGVCDMLRGAIKSLKRKDIFTYKKNGEEVILTRILKNKQFDVIIVDTTSHDLGIQSEYAWLKKFYPGFEHPMQYLGSLDTDQGEKVFDIFPIINEEVRKKIYFDITSFYHEPLEVLLSDNERNMYKIQKLYRKS